MLAGKAPAEAAKSPGVGRQAASAWKAWLDEGAIEALRSMATGRPAGVAARLEDGSPLSLQLCGRTPGTRLLWEVHRPARHRAQRRPSGHQHLRAEDRGDPQTGERAFREIEVAVSDAPFWRRPVGRNVASVYRMMARDLLRGTRAALALMTR